MNYKDSPYLVEVFDFDILHMQLNTPLYIFVLVVVVLFLLNRLLFKPVLRTLDNRAQLAGKLESTVAGSQAEVAKLAQDYEAKLVGVREEVARVRQETMRQAQSEVAGILEKARAEAQAEFQAAMTELRTEVQQAKTALGDASQRLAEKTTNRILQA